MDPVRIHNHTISAPEELVNFCISKCTKRKSEIGHWSHAYVGRFRNVTSKKECNVNCICIKEASIYKTRFISLRKMAQNILDLISSTV